MRVGRLSSGAVVTAVRHAGTWGLVVDRTGKASAWQPRPAEIEISTNDGASARRVSAGYRSLRRAGRGVIGVATLHVARGVKIRVTDRWSVEGARLTASRALAVDGTTTGGFASAITWRSRARVTRGQVDYFAPAVIYRSTRNLQSNVIGGAATYGPGFSGITRIREDRLPAPMFGIRFRDGTSITTLDRHPDGATTASDYADLQTAPMIDRRFGFGAIGAEHRGRQLRSGFWFPGSEGEVTLTSDPNSVSVPFPPVHRWRRREHPLRDGQRQHYQLAFRFGRGESWARYRARSWRWAWSELQPRVRAYDTGVIRRTLIDMLSQRAATVGNRTGIDWYWNAVTGKPVLPTRFALLGFLGKNLEAAQMLIEDAIAHPTAASAARRELAYRIIKTFTALPMSPPAAEGINLDTGIPQAIYPQVGIAHLRPLTDDMTALLRAYRTERRAGRSHGDWLRWAREFGTWLLTQQRPDGSFPRAWRDGTGVVADPSPSATYEAVPFLLLLGRASGESRYERAAVRAGAFAWRQGRTGQFVGATIDQPNVQDKEAASLSTEAYLALFEHTKDRRWLRRATAAADATETWTYIWNVPMPAGVPNTELHWKRGVPTIGASVVVSGQSSVDQYQAYNVDLFARLYRYTKDRHYLSVARLLLHGTKSMLALPGRTYDLAGAGWQQENWNFSNRRGRGSHRNWLPWVGVSHLKGILATERFDRRIFRRIASPGRR